MSTARSLSEATGPADADAPLPRTAMLTALRPSFGWLVRQLWAPETYGAEHVPTHGPVILAANHIGWLDGPLLAILSPRPVHALTKKEMFASPAMREFLLGAGQIPLQRGRLDAGAIRIALASLAAGHVVGVFPEGGRGAGEARWLRPGSAYLAMVSGAPVVPAAFLGTRLPGGAEGSLPPRGSRVTLTFGEPVRLRTQEWPRRRDDVRRGTEAIGAALQATIAEARQRTGLELPGPVPDEPPHTAEQQHPRSSHE